MEVGGESTLGEIPSPFRSPPSLGEDVQGGKMGRCGSGPGAKFSNGAKEMQNVTMASWEPTH